MLTDSPRPPTSHWSLSPATDKWPEAHDAAIDAAEIGLLRASLGEDADRIIHLFLVETAARLRRMASLHDRQARGTLAREAHSLKSAAATFGCATLAMLALALEDEARTIEADALPARIAALAAAYEKARDALLTH